MPGGRGGSCNSWLYQKIRHCTCLGPSYSLSVSHCVIIVLSDRLAFSFRRLKGSPYSCRLRLMHIKIVAQPRIMIVYHRQDGGLEWRRDCTSVTLRPANDWHIVHNHRDIGTGGMTDWVTEWLTARYNAILTFFFRTDYKLQSPASGSFRRNGPRSRKRLPSTQPFTFLIHLAISF
jgi:hypothetical protein